MTWRAIKLRLETGDTLELRSFVDSSEFLSSERSVLIQSANFLRKRGNFSECLKIIEFLKAAPNDEGENLLFLLGDLFHDTKEFEECVKVYSEILARNPSDIAFNNRGLALWELKRFQEAYDDYIAALSINPLNTTALRGAGEMSLKLFWYEQAESFFQRAIGEDSDYVDAWIGLGLSKFHLGDISGAESDFRTALTRDPVNEIAGRGIAECRKRQD